jgi:glycosyltransferase involved in cell wall biosynthesis
VPPAVSVFTAAHADGAQLDRALRSLTAQTFEDWEWVVVDDTPGGRLLPVLSALADTDGARGRLRALAGPAAGSVGAAKAAAVATCRGALLVELDHDDELLPSALATVHDAFALRPEVDLVFSDWVDAVDGTPRALYPEGWGFGFGAHAAEWVGGAWAPVALAPALTWETVRHLVAMPNHLRAWRAGALRSAGGYDPALPVADDYDLLVRTFLTGRAARVPRPLYLQHAHPGSLSRARNEEIQRRVAEIAADRERDLDARCLALGAIPSGPAPLTGPAALAAAGDLVDPATAAAAARGTPLVSVVVAATRPDALRRALASALAQTYPELEVLVVGDGCPEAVEVARECGDDRVRAWSLEERHHDGGAAARNVALKAMARGDLVAYLDDDNTWAQSHLASLVAALRATPGASWAFSSFRVLGETVVCRRPRRYRIDTSALLHRRELVARFGGWLPAQDADAAHDWELASRWHDAGEPWAATGLPTLDYTLPDDARGRAVLAEILAAG